MEWLVVTPAWLAAESAMRVGGRQGGTGSIDGIGGVRACAAAVTFGEAVLLRNRATGEYLCAAPHSDDAELDGFGRPVGGSSDSSSDDGREGGGRGRDEDEDEDENEDEDEEAAEERALEEGSDVVPQMAPLLPRSGSARALSAAEESSLEARAQASGRGRSTVLLLNDGGGQLM